MALVMTIDNAYQLQTAMRKCDRDYYTLTAYEMLLDLFDECGNDVEFDPVAICCDFNEEDLDEIMDDYGHLSDFAECRDDDGEINKSKLLDVMNYYTWAVETVNDTILFQAF